MKRLLFFKTINLLLGIILVVFFSIGSVRAQDFSPSNRAYKTDVSRKGTSAGTMLEIGVGARAEAIGGAFTAIADDPSALYWNPAGITNISSIAAQFTRLNWLVDTKFHALDLVVPLPMMSWAVGFHLAMLDYGTSPVRTIFRPEGTGEFYSAKDMVAGLYLGMAITDRISVGLGAKYFYERIWHVDGSNIAFDVSILYKTALKGLRIGGAIANFGPEFRLSGRDLTRAMDSDGRRDIFFNNDQVPVNLETEKYPLPLLFRFGLAYDWEFNQNNILTISSDLNHPSSSTESINLGMEFKTMNAFYLRAGYQSLFERGATNGLTLGGGLKYKVLGQSTITVDYSWSDWSILDSVNRFTVGISAY
ncbi:MAG: UPF0164 family protein [Calditrichaeota bacterium]|nr:UPF0164 family protein [Calditrichota bacterium]